MSKTKQSEMLNNAFIMALASNLPWWKMVVEQLVYDLADDEVKPYLEISKRL